MHKIALICFLSMLTGLQAQEWQGFGNYEYFYESEYAEGGYDEASCSCAAQGAILAVVKTEEIQSFVWSLTDSLANTIVIGLIRIDDGPNDFQWLDGTAVADGFTNWEKSEPDNANNLESCVVMMGNLKGMWKNHACRGQKQFICQRQINSTTQSTELVTTQTTEATTIQSTELASMQTTKAATLQTTEIAITPITEIPITQSTQPTEMATTQSAWLSTIQSTKSRSTHSTKLATSESTEVVTAQTTLAATTQSTKVILTQSTEVAKTQSKEITTIQSKEEPTTQSAETILYTDTSLTVWGTSEGDKATTETTIATSQNRHTFQSTSVSIPISFEASSSIIKATSHKATEVTKFTVSGSIGSESNTNLSTSMASGTMIQTGIVVTTTAQSLSPRVWKLWHVITIAATGGSLCFFIILILILLCVKRKKKLEKKKTEMDTESAGYYGTPKRFFSWLTFLQLQNYNRDRLIPRPSVVAKKTEAYTNTSRD